MGAHIDQTRKAYFLPVNLGVETAMIGATRMLFIEDWAFIEKTPPKNDKEKSWSVCPHLSTPEGLFDYYMASGRIMLLLGKCFCYDCYGMVLFNRDLVKFMDSCQHMTDQRFQEDFIDPLFQINREVFKPKKNLAWEGASRWTWTSCSHVSKGGQLAGLYTRCTPIFFYEGFVTCNDCTEVVPSASLYLQTLLDCEALTDDQLQERVVDQLYLINSKVLKSVRDYGR